MKIMDDENNAMLICRYDDDTETYNFELMILYNEALFTVSRKISVPIYGALEPPPDKMGVYLSGFLVLELKPDAYYDWVPLTSDGMDTFHNMWTKTFSINPLSPLGVLWLHELVWYDENIGGRLGIMPLW